MDGNGIKKAAIANTIMNKHILDEEKHKNDGGWMMYWKMYNECSKIFNERRSFW